MTHYRPRAELQTHDVANQPPPFENKNVFESDTALKGAAETRGAAAHLTHLSAYGASLGSADVIDWARQAHANPPKLVNFDRYGHRLDEVEFHPAYHHLMKLGLSCGFASLAWTAKTGGHAAHVAMVFMQAGAEPGVGCPMTMTYAAVPALRHEPAIAKEWVPRILACDYDPHFVPAADKKAATIGMAMTEKQGGSDIRANTTVAAHIVDDEYELTGHTWFCSAPMCDAFLTLAQTEAGVTCFLVPRWRPDGTRNAFHIMRLKDKLGDRSNASSEIEYHGAFAQRVGEEGRGVRTIIEMVNHTRLDCLAGSAGLIRQAAAAAVWHSDRRNAFQRRLVDQPLMREVLAELSMEADGVIALAFRVSESFDRAGEDEHEAALARVLTPLAKYWICKRAPYLVYEAMEAHGGAGYVEEHPLPRMFRQSPLNAIWEGSGNVIALDVLRALSRDTAARDALARELSSVTGRHPALDARIRDLSRMVETGVGEADARRFAEHAALALTAASLIRAGLDPVAEAFIGRRIEESAIMLGAGSARIDSDTLIGRARLTV